MDKQSEAATILTEAISSYVEECMLYVISSDSPYGSIHDTTDMVVNAAELKNIQVGDDFEKELNKILESFPLSKVSIDWGELRPILYPAVSKAVNEFLKGYF